MHQRLFWKRNLQDLIRKMFEARVPFGRVPALRRISLYMRQIMKGFRSYFKGVLGAPSATCGGFSSLLSHSNSLRQTKECTRYISLLKVLNIFIIVDRNNWRKTSFNMTEKEHGDKTPDKKGKTLE